MGRGWDDFSDSGFFAPTSGLTVCTPCPVGTAQSQSGEMRYGCGMFTHRGTTSRICFMHPVRSSEYSASTSQVGRCALGLWVDSICPVRLWFLSAAELRFLSQ